MHVICNVTKVYEYNGHASRCMFDITVVHCVSRPTPTTYNREFDETVKRCVTFVPSEVFISSSGFIRLDSNFCHVKVRDRDRYETGTISI